MRISDLLEESGHTWDIELQAKEQSIINEIQPQEIKGRVNQSLNVIPMERKIYMKQKVLRLVATICLLFAVSGGTVLAINHFDVLKAFFLGDVTMIEGQVKVPNATVSTKDYKLTVEEMLVDEYNILLITSVEALSDQGKAVLAKDGHGFWWGRNSQYLAVGEAKFSYSMAECRYLKDKNTAEKHYWAINIGNIEYDQGAKIEIYPNNYELPDLKVTIPIINELPSRKITVQMPSSRQGEAPAIMKINITPLSLYVTAESNHGLQELPTNGLLFRMEDGSIKTQNQMVDSGTRGIGQSNEGEGDNLIQSFHIDFRYRFSKPIDPAKIKAVIVNGKEYSLDNPNVGKDVKIDPLLLPFEIKPPIKDGDLVVPIEEFCQRLGADFKWDKKAGTVDINYRGDKIELAIGSKEAKLNGEVITLFDPVEVYQGQLISNSKFAGRVLNVGLERTNVENPDPYSWNWIVKP